MKNTYLLSSLLICASALALSLPAQAQTSRIYFAGYLGLNTFDDQEFTEKSTSSSGDFGLDSANSFAGAIGLRLSRHLRLEGELSYRNAEFQNADIAGGGGGPIGGEIDSTIAMANLYYDFDVPWKIQPYVGAGIGYGWHGGDVADTTGTLVSSNIDDSALVWNAALGFKYRPRTDFAFNVGYRYLSSPNLEFGSYEMDYRSHEFRLGMEWDLPTR